MRVIIPWLSILMFMSGCAGGPSMPSGAVDISLEDARVSAAVRTALLNDRDIGSLPIAVECRAGTVTLTGRVRTADDATRAEEIVRRVAGVTSVESKLRVEPAARN